MAVLLAFQEIPAAAQSRDAHAATSGTVRHWGTFFGGASTFKPEDMTTSPASVSLPGSVAEVATSNSSQYALLTNGSVYAWGLGNAGQLGDGATKNSFTKPVRVRTIAGGDYVVAGNCPIGAIAKGYEKVFRSWLPKSGRQVRKAPSFLVAANRREGLPPTFGFTDIYVPLEVAKEEPVG